MASRIVSMGSLTTRARGEVLLVEKNAVEPLSLRQAAHIALTARNVLSARVEVSHEEIILFGIIVHLLAMAAAGRSTNASIDSGGGDSS